jgi:hypothetical protein
MRSLRKFGLLLETDAKLPSVSALVAGELIRGSWWAHSRAHDIFRILQQIADHKDVMVVKLISAKVTFVHRALWPDLLTVATARERWQTQGLSAGARVLMKTIDEHGAVRTDQLTWPERVKEMKPGEAARELEKRLLIHAQELHTETGAHAKLLESWQRWANRIGFEYSNIELSEARHRLETIVRKLNGQFAAAATLPWTRLA